jgi:hypothetical protein
MKGEGRMMVKDDEFDKLCLNYRDLDKGKKEKLVWIGEQLLTIKKSLDNEAASPAEEKNGEFQPNIVT